ncbi:MAG: MoaD/ThiS family protein [Chloroflexi bacterium]|nr:MoaD/ThiS family protein [Chloroflexota bacterium]
MRVNLKLLVPALPEAAGRKEIEVEFAGKTVNDLLRHLVKQYGKAAKQGLYDNEGELDPIIQILLNGKEWVSHDQLDTVLQDGDEVAFMAMIAGG